MNSGALFRGRMPAIFLILLAGTLVYANSFQVPFTLDDQHSIVENEDIRGLERFHASPTRYVAYLTFALNYQIGGLEVTGYHAVNLAIHLITALLVYTLLHLTFLTPFFQRPSTPNSKLKTQIFIPLFAALLFAVHPIQTQAVTYIVQRITSLATLFYLLSLVLYVTGRVKFDANVVRGGRLTPWLFLAGSVVAAVLAMKTKEIAFTLPFMVLLYELFFFRGGWQRRLLYLFPLLSTLPVIPLTVLSLGESTGDLLSDVSEQSRVQTGMSRLGYLFTQFRVIVTYLRLLIFPANQNLDYDYPAYTTFLSLPVFTSFLLLAALAALGLFLYRASRRGEPTLRLISFGICWFFLALAVESSLIPIVDVIFEHRLYLPSVGTFAAFAAAFFLLSEKAGMTAAPRWPLAVAAVLLTCLSVATWQRNLVWGSELRLWQDVVSKSPNKGRAQNNLGVALEAAGKTREAAETLRRAIQVDPGYAKAYYNLADLYLVNGYPEEALPLLETAIRISPNFNEAYVKTGAALIRGRKFQEAEDFLTCNLDRIGETAEARFYLGAAYVFLGKKAAAKKELAVVSKLDPALASDLAGLLGKNLQSSLP